MVRFEVRQEVRAPPDFVIGWWTDYRDDDAKLGGQMEARRVRRLDASHIQVDTDLVVGGRKVRLEGVVTLEGPRSFSMESSLAVSGKPFGHESIRFSTEPQGEGSLVVAHFHFRGRTLVHGLLLFLTAGSTRRGREQAYWQFAKEIEADYAAQAAGRPAR